jgi:hypothetical protein
MFITLTRDLSFVDLNTPGELENLVMAFGKIDIVFGAAVHKLSGMLHYTMPLV